MKKSFIYTSFAFLYLLAGLATFFDNPIETSIDTLPTQEKANMEILSSVDANLPDITNHFSTANVVENTPRVYSFPYSVINTDSTAIDAGNNIMHYIKNGANFYYAHSDRGFTDLKYLTEGSLFVVDGQTFRVARAELLTHEETQKVMNSIAYAKKDGVKYDASFMTCSGANNYWYNGQLTANHRLVIYAYLA